MYDIHTLFLFNLINLLIKQKKKKKIEIKYYNKYHENIYVTYNLDTLEKKTVIK